MKSNSKVILPVMVQILTDTGQSDDLVKGIINLFCPWDCKDSCLHPVDCTECWEAVITARLRGEDDDGAQEHEPDDHTDVDQ